MKINHPISSKLRFAVIVVLFPGSFLAASHLLACGPIAAQSANKKAPKSKPAPKNAVVDVVMPFHVGETLKYQVAWAAFTSAASVQLNVEERRDLFGWGTWHFRATAHTVSPVRNLFSLDDQFDSYTDAASLESRQYEMYLNELGKKQDRVFHPLPMGQAPRGDVPHVVVQPGTRDPLGALYALRSVDWQKTPEFRAPVYDGRDVYEMRSRLEAASEEIVVTAGKYSASRISIRLFQHDKEVSGLNFSAWLAHDLSRTPVLLQADLPFGNLRVELISATQ
ncbi:MAG: DUF3108 domain-containing protein [Candidatus Acidiferrales bacterium]